MNQAEKDSRRSYQDTPHPDFRKHVGIWADLERLRPRGDCVVIRVIPEPELHANLIWIPETARGKGDNSPRIGEVVAVGKGDRMFPMRCRDCEIDPMGDNGPQYRTEFAKRLVCKHCGGPLEFLRNPQTDKTVVWRTPMHVKPGDWVYYWRVMANQIEVNKELYQIVREEQHILAVLEKESNGTRN